MGFTKQDVPNDNSCMFHAILKQIKNNHSMTDVQNLRNLVVEYQNELDISFHDEIKRMKNVHVWGNDIALAIISNRLNLCIHVYRNKNWQIIDQNTINIYRKNKEKPTENMCSKTIYLWNDGRHFQILKPHI